MVDERPATFVYNGGVYAVGEVQCNHCTHVFTAVRVAGMDPAEMRCIRCLRTGADYWCPHHDRGLQPEVIVRH